MAVAVTICGSLAACGGKKDDVTANETSIKSTVDSTKDDSEKKDELITIKGFAMEGPYTKGKFNDLAMWKVVEKATGVKVDFESAPSSAINEKVKLMFASNKLPDLFFKIPFTSADVTNYSSQGSIIPLNDLFAQNAPNFSKYLSEDPSIEKGIRMSDKKIYGFPYLVTCTASRVTPKLLVNQKWLEQDKLEMPKTLDDLYQMAVKFKDSDFNKNGEKDEIPICFEAIWAVKNSLFGSYGLMNRGANSSNWDIDPETNELRFINTAERYKEFLQFVNKLYTEKLMDQEVFTMEIAKLTAKAEQNVFGFAFIGNSNYLGKLKEDFTHIPSTLAGPHGDDMYSARTTPLAGQNTFITKNNQYPAETVKWVDYFYSQEGIRTFFMGIEGETWEMGPDNKPKFTDFVVKNPDGLGMEEVLGRYVCWSGGANPSVADNIHFGDHLIPKSSVDSANVLIPYTPKEIWGSFVYTPEQLEKLTILQTDIDTYVTDMQAKFISGKVGFDKWDEYVKQVEKLGLQEYKKIVQEALDTYNS